MGMLSTKICGEEDVFLKLLMLGLDNAGKTTILYRIVQNEMVKTCPTAGFNVEMVTPCNGVNLSVWDVGGQRQLRPIWIHYISGTRGLIYVVDSSDRKRMPEAAEELFRILNSPDMSASCPLLVLANKTDMPNAMESSEIIDILNLQSVRKRKWLVQSCCAKTGKGVHEAVTELGRLVKEHKT
ncbi:ADP-ribosylation factor 6-like [Ylistrum balloti]|uniref:ADP-ribosylation factor 6-like n=1 Tax=Ylistrum balloti TaxID=509963 RepID=UPI002905D89A|nr:ADP-ribosylation factor 6-like [Ylistrum balloti]